MAESRNLGRYELLRILGKGAMGVVYEGLDPTLGRRVAVKTILTSIALDPDVERSYAARFTQEANAVARLNHPNIVQVYDFGVEGDVAYLVMEFIEGRELRSIIDDDERLGIDEIVRIMYELLDALDFAHEAGVIHRDVKPATVMLDARRRAKLADFGVARIQDGGQRTQADTMVGSPAFMSPEQIAGVKIDRRTDIFSAGVILYQLLCGDKPFKGEGPWAVMAAISNDSAAAPSLVRPGIPPVFDAIVARSLAKQPEYRFATAREFAAALRTAIGGGIIMPAPKDDDRPTRHTSDAELEFWRAIQGTGDPAELETYIDRFPDGTYSKLAKVKLSRLRDARKPDGTVATSAGEAATLVVEHRTAPAQSPPKKKRLAGTVALVVAGAIGLLGTALWLKGPLGSDKLVIVVDVLDSKTRTTIPGAYWMPGAGLGQFYGAETRAFAAALDKLSGGNKNRPLVFLCVSAECWLSYNASLRAVQVGYRNVSWFRGGTDAWTGAGFARKNPERID